MEMGLAEKLGRITGGAVKPQDSQSYYKSRGTQGKAHCTLWSDIGKGLEHCSPLGHLGEARQAGRQAGRLWSGLYTSDQQQKEMAVLCSFQKRRSPGAMVQQHRAPDPRAPKQTKLAILLSPWDRPK